ncbi:glycerophosphodiester phosphodiesterase [Vaginisenegalia massiliensis]|uniref:glycerophosphodiester phosphodiesterase n=1 Tax=Vaginisenegalia massiliensis TaxID=2058294 RepID=UPI000F537500|nr:glycerophosphodiester phosphodiesterase [Vaginisenegalia massiliensis]
MVCKIIAHRGFSSRYPENTLLAFKKAVEFGCDGIELDVHLTRDQEVVICHDESIDRTSNGHGLIKDLTLAQLKQYRFDKGYDSKDPFELVDIQIPTLSELLEWLKTKNLEVNIEIKNNIFSYPGIVEKVLNLVTTYGVEDRTIISSFNHYTIQEVKKQMRNMKCGFLTETTQLDPGRYCYDYQVECYHPDFQTLIPQVVESCRDHQIELNVWTVNQANQMKALAALPVHRIITNEVALAKQIL